MILQALKEYYDRKATDPETNMAPLGFEWKEIPYVLVVRSDGTPVSLECTYEGQGKQRRAAKHLVPQAIKKTSCISANLLWDNPEYVFGVSVDSGKTRADEKHAAFIERIAELEGDDEGLNAAKKFMRLKDKAEILKSFPEWGQVLAEGRPVSFRLAGDTCLIVERPKVKSAVKLRFPKPEGEKSVCLISGAKDDMARLHDSIKGVWGAQTSGANIVSFNLDAFNSYGKTQGANAPIGKIAAFAYSTALNHLLGKDSKQRLQVGDASTIFWAEKDSALEQQMPDFFGESPKDDPDRNARTVESLFKAVKAGAFLMDADRTRFYVLGLAPNASRISVRFWINSTVADMASKIRAHFEDLQINHGPKEKDVLSLFRLLVSIAVQGKADNIPPNLGGETMKTILSGLPYPQTLFQATVRRVRAEHEVSYPRASLLKACINRATRFANPDIKEELKVSLDPENNNSGYRLGRLFSALEKIQQEANPGINATIRDRFYGAASSTPLTVFGNLMRLKNHHLAKLDNPGRRVNFERLIGGIVDGISDFPAHLSLADQGRFAVGYYHQMQDFFTKKDNSKEE